MRVAILELVGPQPDGDVHVARDEKTERGRHHADDRVAVTSEGDALADRSGIRHEPLLPERVAQHHGACRAWRIVDLGEGPAERGLRSENVEEVGADHPGRNPIRIPYAGQIEAVPPEPGHAGEDVPRLSAPVAIVGVRDREFLEGLVAFTHDQDPFWMRVRIRAD
jgi:hypothetical protein